MAGWLPYGGLILRAPGLWSVTSGERNEPHNPNPQSLTPNTPPAAPVLLLRRPPSRRRRGNRWLVLFLAIQFPHVDALIGIVQQVSREIVRPSPGDVVRIRPVGVPLSRQNHEVEALVGLDQRVRQAIRIAGVNVVVDVPVTSIRWPFRFPAISEFLS